MGPHSKYNLMTACKKCDKRKKRYLPLQLIYQGAAFTHHLPGDASPPVRDPTKFSLPQQNKKDIKQNNLLQQVRRSWCEPEEGGGIVRVAHDVPCLDHPGPQIADGMVDRGMPLHGPTFCKNFITVYNEVRPYNSLDASSPRVVLCRPLPTSHLLLLCSFVMVCTW